MTTEVSKKEKIMITISVMLATLLQVIDSTIANVALPHMQGSLSAGLDQISWVLTSYIVSSAIMTAPVGWLAGKYGIKHIFLISVAGFIVASALCGLSTSVTQIVLFRLMQGMFGAALVPLSQATLFDINPPEKHGQAMAIWGVGVMVGPIIGPTLGGYLTESFNWRWVFYVNIPFGILAMIGIAGFFKTSAVKPKKFDFIGFGLLSIFIACTQLVMDRGHQLDWLSSNEIILYCVVGSICLWFLLLHTRYALNSFISVVLFKDRNFQTGSMMMFVIGIVLIATSMVFSTLLQNIMHYPVITTGVLLMPRGFGTMIAMIIVGKLINKVGAKPLIFTGLCAISTSLWIMTSYSLVLPHNLFISSTFIQGIGIGLTFGSLSIITFSHLSDDLRTEATAFFSLIRNVGGSIGIAVTNEIIKVYTQVNRSVLTENVSVFDHKFAEYMIGMERVTNNFKTSLAILDREINLQAYFIGYLNNFKFLMVISIMILPLLFILQSKKP